MSTQVALQEPGSGWKPPPAKPLDEAVWQAWVAKGRARDRRKGDVRMKALKLASIGVLLVAAGLWSYLTPYAVIVRFMIAAAAITAMIQAFQTRHYAMAGVLGTVALLYNPVVPVFSFSGDWRRALLIASTAPFIVSLAWRNRSAAHD